MTYITLSYKFSNKTKARMRYAYLLCLNFRWVTHLSPKDIFGFLPANAGLKVFRVLVVVVVVLNLVTKFKSDLQRRFRAKCY